ncbi:MAG: MFS transporter [Solirubrobacterales bacterium]|nr:MFS transporter [Solirubrobacterales bacterium]OJU94832.1 MAG: MFS transporter [Solirubrobacterales bacterium 67-14]
MLVPLRHPVYRRLFTAQVIALVGTGLATVALSLLAFDLAGDNAGVVVGIALALKMVAYVTVSPVVTAWTRGVSRKRLLICLDLTRALAVVSIAFVTEIWQIYVLIFFLNACSAGFTPTFQAVIPDVLEDEDTYTEALSLSRLAYELEGLASPAIAAALLGLVSYSGLFAGNAVAFLISASLVFSTTIPQPRIAPKMEQALRKVSHGIRLYLSIPRLRGLFALNLAAAAASAMVIVNTVIYVKGDFGLGDAEVAWGLGAAGAGSMVVAMILPKILRRASDRSLMLGGGAMLAVGLIEASLLESLPALMLCWFFLGCGLALVQTPAGRLIQRSANSDERPALFAAQFSLSHFCWLLTYPIAGVLGSALGLSAVAIILAALAGLATVLAWLLWRPPSSRVEGIGSHA